MYARIIDQSCVSSSNLTTQFPSHVCVSMLVLAHLEDPSRKTCPVCVSMLVLAHLEDPSRKTCPVCMLVLALC